MVKRPTLGSGSGRDLGVVGSSPASGSCSARRWDACKLRVPSPGRFRRPVWLSPGADEWEASRHPVISVSISYKNVSNGAYRKFPLSCRPRAAWLISTCLEYMSSFYVGKNMSLNNEVFLMRLNSQVEEGIF